MHLLIRSLPIVCHRPRRLLLYGRAHAFGVLAASVSVAMLLTAGAASASERHGLPTSRWQVSNIGDGFVRLGIVRSGRTGVVLRIETSSIDDLAPQLVSRLSPPPADPVIGGVDWSGSTGARRLPVGSEAGLIVANANSMPVVSALIGVPPAARLRMRALATETEHRCSSSEDEAAASSATVMAIEGRTLLTLPLTVGPRGRSRRFGAGPATPRASMRSTAEVAEVTDIAWLRDQRIARIEIRPAWYDAASHCFTVYRSLLLKVSFEAAAGAMPAEPNGGGHAASPFEAVLASHLLNYEAAKSWRARPRASDRGTLERAPGAADARKVAPGRPRYRVEIDADGVYRITGADLRDAGLDIAAVDPQELSLTNRGERVAVLVTGEDDGRLDPEDALLFYAQRLRGEVMTTKYTDTNVYWLSVDSGPGLRMDALDGSPGSSTPVVHSYRTVAHAEESVYWYSHHFTSEDTWFWYRFSPGPGASASHTFTRTLSAIAPGPVVVRGDLVSRNGRRGHHTKVLLNDLPEPLDDAVWDGRSRHSFEAELPQTGLREGENSLTVSVINDGPTLTDDVYFDWFEVEYNRKLEAVEDALEFNVSAGGLHRFDVSGLSTRGALVLDVTEPLRPVRIEGVEAESAGEGYVLSFDAGASEASRLLVTASSAVRKPKAVIERRPTGLRDPGQGADYIIVSHSKFLDAMRRLGEHRAGQGLRVSLVDLEDVYDEFNSGVRHPHAIREFLSYAYENWQPPAPQYVLLVGDGHWNFKGFGSYGKGPIYMPPNLEWVDPWQGETDSANRLVTIVGDDVLPDMAVGRVPVNTVEEASAFVEKTIAYEVGAGRSCKQNQVFVADNADSNGDYVASSEAVIRDYVPAGAHVQRLYLDAFRSAGTCGDAVGGAQCPELNAAIVEHLNRDGALFVSYTGHAAPPRWAGEQIFRNSDVALLDNGSCLPVVLTMTCLDGYWLHPDSELTSLMELMVRSDDAGAVAAFSPTGLGVSAGHDVLHGGFYAAVFADSIHTLGPAAMAAVLEVFESGLHRELIDTYIVIGDPALVLDVPTSPPGEPEPTPTAPRPPRPRSLLLPWLMQGVRAP